MSVEFETALNLPSDFADASVAGTAKESPWMWADRLGAGLSLSCAAHCLVLPIALALTPSLRAALSELSGESSGWLQWLLWSHQVEWMIALTVISFAAVVLLRGWWQHRDGSALAFWLAGSVTLTSAAAELIPLGYYHGLLLAAGGALIAMAHWRNLGALRKLN